MPEAGRVIAGTARGIRLEGAAVGTRPLTDRVKESLFASLESEGAFAGPFLDLFAGTGAGGIEALSRGAESAVFIERDEKACALIAANLKRARLAGGRIIRGDVLRHLKKGPVTGQPPFRTVLADPPYDLPILASTLDLLGATGGDWLVDDAVVVAKHFWKDSPGEQFGSLTFERQRRFGETMLTFYRQTVPQR